MLWHSCRLRSGAEPEKRPEVSHSLLSRRARKRHNEQDSRRRRGVDGQGRLSLGNSCEDGGREGGGGEALLLFGVAERGIGAREERRWKAGGRGREGASA